MENNGTEKIGLVTPTLDAGLLVPLYSKLNIKMSCYQYKNLH